MKIIHMTGRDNSSPRRSRTSIFASLGPLILLAGSLVQGVVGAPTAVAATSGTLFLPNTSSNPNEDASYPRVIRLAHSGSSNGTLLATFSHSGVGSSPARPILGPGGAGKCIDVNTNTNTNGNAVQIWTCNGVTGQQWTVSSDGTIRAFGKCLDIDGNGTANSTQVELWDCNGVGGQQWREESNGSLLNPQSGRCLYDPAGNTTNGTILQIYDCNGQYTTQRWFAPSATSNFPIYSSTDGGITWSSSPIGTVTDTVHGWGLDGPTLFELPQAEGSLAAGTLLASGTAWVGNDFTQQAIEVFISTDHGVTWSYRSSCASETGQANTTGHGIWEPNFNIDASGNLLCYFSDERPSSNNYNQVLAHVSSSDGGATWGSEVYDVAVQDNVQRPGMTDVVKLPNGSYAMTYEDCKNGYDPDTACSVYFKTSTDGANWTPTSSLGTLIQTNDGRHFLHTPQLAWSPAGGSNGTLIVSAQRVVSGADGSVTNLAESGQVVFTNTNLGTGYWNEMHAPVKVSPTGGYDVGETACPGYSSPLLPSVDGTTVFMLAGTHISNDKCEVQFGSDLISGPTGPITGPGTTGKCIDVNTNTNTSGNAVQLWTCNGVTGQQWSVNADGTYRAFGKCLDIVGNGTANSTKVELWDCNGVGGQQWSKQTNGSLLNPQSGRCLDDPAGNTTNGTVLQIYDCNGLWTQVWN